MSAVFAWGIARLFPVSSGASSPSLDYSAEDNSQYLSMAPGLGVN